MLPDGSINPGEMTSFNHYALGAVGHFLHERVAGLRCVDAGWTKCRVEPLPGGKITKVKVEHVALQGKIGVEWEVVDGMFKVGVRVPAGTVMEVVMPKGEVTQVGAGVWKFEEAFAGYSWPPKAIAGLPNGESLGDPKNQ